MGRTTACPACTTVGTFCPEGGHDSNVLCAVGHHCPTTAQQIECAAGTECPEGSTSESVCGPHTYAGAPGTGQCLQCSGGSEIPATRTLAADHDDEDDCQICASGTARAFGAATNCEVCGPDTYSEQNVCGVSTTGPIACINCPANTFTNDADPSNPVAADHDSPAAVILPRKPPRISQTLPHHTPHPQ